MQQINQEKFHKNKQSVRCRIQQLTTYQLRQKKTKHIYCSIQEPSYKIMINPHHHNRGRNSTIKQEQEQNKNNNLQNDSSISMHQDDNNAHYYDLDYSDENLNQGLVSSSDQNQRQITHQQFMHMIVTNQHKRKQTQSQSNSYQQQSPQQQSYYHQQNYSKYTHSNQPKRHQQKRYTSQTRDKSSQFYSYGINKILKQEKNDPQKSSNIKNNLKLSKQTSFINAENSVRQFKIDSLLNVHSQLQKQTKIQKNKQQKRPQIFQKSQQDQSFSLITLPEYDQESYSSIAEKENIQHNNIQQNKRNLKKYKDIAKSSTEEENHLQKLNWRYQQAKLKFMDNFLPESLKIGSNSYNMLKYMNKKQQLAYNILKM